jgi:hypothetical protein
MKSFLSKNENYSVKGNRMAVATWNLRSLVENSGDVRICRKRVQVNPNSVVDRKLDLMTKELKRFGISIAGIHPRD